MKCFYFPEWKEEKDVMISLDQKKLKLVKEIPPGHMKVSVAGWIRNSLNNFDKAMSFNNFDYWNDCSERYSSSFDELYEDLYLELGRKCDNQFNEMEINEKGILMSIPSDPILAKLCEITGAKMYGDYLVLETNDNWFYANNIRIQGDIIRFNCAFNTKFYRIVTDNGIIFDSTKLSVNPTEYFDGNIFHEYSKYLRKEDNQFEDIARTLNIIL